MTELISSSTSDDLYPSEAQLIGVSVSRLELDELGGFAHRLALQVVCMALIHEIAKHYDVNIPALLAAGKLMPAYIIFDFTKTLHVVWQIRRENL